MKRLKDLPRKYWWPIWGLKVGIDKDIWLPWERDAFWYTMYHMFWICVGIGVIVTIIWIIA